MFAGIGSEGDEQESPFRDGVTVGSFISLFGSKIFEEGVTSLFFRCASFDGDCCNASSAGAGALSRLDGGGSTCQLTLDWAFDALEGTEGDSSFNFCSIVFGFALSPSLPLPCWWLR